MAWGVHIYVYMYGNEQVQVNIKSTSQYVGVISIINTVLCPATGELRRVDRARAGLLRDRERYDISRYVGVISNMNTTMHMVGLRALRSGVTL